jgi:hypothetical protein
MKINSKEYWENRFRVGDWAQKGGPAQTSGFAKSQLKHLRINNKFRGVICDFGCGTGDAFPVYRKAWPHAELLGVDVSETAVKSCTAKYGSIATFFCGSHSAVPRSDIIISSNTFEHLENQHLVAADLLGKCKILYIVVPFNECLSASGACEHINTYDHNTFNYLGTVSTVKFISKGWGLSGFRLYYDGYLKNIARAIIRRPLYQPAYQIMYKITHKNQKGCG